MPRSHSTVKLSRDIPPPLPWSQQLVFLSTLRSWHCIPSFDCSSPPISSPPPPQEFPEYVHLWSLLLIVVLGGMLWKLHPVIMVSLPLLPNPTLFYYFISFANVWRHFVLRAYKKDRFYRDEVAVLWHWPWIIRVQWRRLYKPLILGAEVNDAARLVC